MTRAGSTGTGSLRLWTELRLLCRRGVGIPAIAPQLCQLIRRIVPYDAGAVAWLDDAGMPIGFYQENQPTEIKELFANEYETLFAGPGEYGVAWMLQQKGRTIGNWLSVVDDVLDSNTYNLWMRPLGYRSLCDIRVEVAGRPKALFTFYREARWPFTDADLAGFAMIEPYLQRAASPDDRVLWTPDDRAEEYLVTDAAGLELVSLSPGAEALLKRAQFIGQEVSLVGTLSAPPVFAREMCATYRMSGLTRASLAADTGRLAVSMRPLSRVRTPNGPCEPQMLFSMTYERPQSVRVVDDILAMKLSPLRSELLQWAASGGRRSDALREFGVSKEALKKHLAEIYRATGTREWDELQARFHTG